MLTHLAIRDFILIQQLDLTCHAGLTALTGETGAGKSILLDAVAFILGGKADSSLIAAAADQAIITAAFSVPARHPARILLTEQGFDRCDDDIIIRRTLARDGKGKVFINDQPSTLTFLKQMGPELIEIHGQFDTHGLLNPASHIHFLDQYGKTSALCQSVAAAWQHLRQCRATVQSLIDNAARARQEEEYLRFAVSELKKLGPLPDEEEGLASVRQNLVNREKLCEAMNSADAQLQKADDALRNARRTLDRLGDKAGDVLDTIITLLDNAADNGQDASRALQHASEALLGDERSLTDIEDRLYALRSMARKYNCAVVNLPEKLAAFEEQLLMLDNQEKALQAANAALAAAQRAYQHEAELLSAARVKQSVQMIKKVSQEFAPLKLEKAQFTVDIETLPLDQAGPNGLDKVQFLIAANPGTPAAPLHKVASGGELARFMLALKVVLAGGATIPTLIFDEVDSGIGGAVADAVGQRLALLAQHYQVLVVTHSPQVAAKANTHWRVEKSSDKKQTSTRVIGLDNTTRMEEIARMLSGAEISNEARAAAAKLLKAG